MIFKSKPLRTTALTIEEAELIISQAIADMKEIANSGRIRNPEYERIRLERNRSLIDFCMGYCFMQISKDFLKLRIEFNNLIKES